MPKQKLILLWLWKCHTPGVWPIAASFGVFFFIFWKHRCSFVALLLYRAEDSCSPQQLQSRRCSWSQHAMHASKTREVQAYFCSSSQQFPFRSVSKWATSFFFFTCRFFSKTGAPVCPLLSLSVIKSKKKKRNMSRFFSFFFFPVYFSLSCFFLWPFEAFSTLELAKGIMGQSSSVFWLRSWPERKGWKSAERMKDRSTKIII